MIEKCNDFNKFVENMINKIANNEELIIDEEKFQSSFFYQSSHSPDNLEAMKYIEYGMAQNEYQPNIETYGLKIKGKNKLISDIAYTLGCPEIRDYISRQFPELTIQEIKGALRVITIILTGLECRKFLD